MDTTPLNANGSGGHADVVVADETPAKSTPKGSRGQGRWRESAPAVLMATPATIGLIVFVALPFIIAIVLSFFNAQLNQVRPLNFLGFDYYVRLFTDPVTSGPFLRSLLNNFVFAVVVIPLQTGLALMLAVLLNRKLKGIAFFRTFFFLPVVFPMALVAVIWRLILDRGNSGLLNATLSFLTAGNFSGQDWLGSSATALGSVIVLSIWQGVGFQMIIILAALQEIPAERYEAASLDRANPWQQFVHITVPGIRNTLIFVVLLTTIYAFRVYDQVYILIRTAGGNEESLRTVLYTSASTAQNSNNVGLASAMTVIFFVIVVALTVLQRTLLSQRSDG